MEREKVLWFYPAFSFFKVDEMKKNPGNIYLEATIPSFCSVLG
jgi:hypothetical protein